MATGPPGTFDMTVFHAKTSFQQAPISSMSEGQILIHVGMIHFGVPFRFSFRTIRDKTPCDVGPVDFEALV